MPDTAAGRRVRWYLDRLADPRPLTADEMAANFEPGATVWAPPLEDARAWALLADQARSSTEGIVVEASSTELELVAATPEGRRWRYRFAVDPATQRFLTLVLEWVQEERVHVRWAVEADGPALADIERRSPMIVGDVKVTIDRGSDYFAVARLMEEVGVALAEVDGVPAAVNCAATHTACVDGKPYRLAYYHHLRILPEHQRKGLFQQLNRLLSERFSPPYVDGTYAYVARDNAASQRLFSFAEAWPVPPLLCELPVDKVRGPRAGRPAVREDGPRIVDLINAAHTGEEMFSPYSANFLSARLERAPQQYTWSSLRLAESAVVGVWPAGDSFTVLTEGPDGSTVDREALVLDYGLLPGGDRDYEELLRGWCGELADRGHTQLMTFTSPRSPNYPVLRDLGAEMRPFDLFLQGPERPEAAGERGVYVDLIHF